MPHPCAAWGCQAVVGTQRPFCVLCWRLLPLALQRRVWLSWRDPEAWQAAVAEAVGACAQAERARVFTAGRWQPRDRAAAE